MALYQLGLCVIPTRYREKKGAVRWKPFQHRRPDSETVREWFRDTDSSQIGIGVVLGSVSGGLLVRDFDVKASYDAWVRSRPSLAKTLPTSTTRRGAHVYFASEGYKRSTDAGFVRDLGDGELRGDRHIVLCPPTIHPKSGEPYRWINEPRDSIPVIDLQTFGLCPQMRDGDGSSASHYDVLRTRAGYAQNDYATADATAKASFDELDSLLSKINTDNAVSNVLAAINQACAKHGV